MDSRFVSGSKIYDLATNGWCIKSDFTPPTANLMPVIASGIPSADYAGGELVDEFVGDIQLSVPLIYKGTAPQSARRALEAFIRTGVKMRALQFQIRQERAFDIVPLWGQWGAWQTFEVIHAGVVAGDDRSWIGDVNGWHYADLVLTCKPAILGQEQQVALALGAVAENIGADGLSTGVTVTRDDTSFLKLPTSAIDVTAGTITIVWKRGSETLAGGSSFIFYDDTGLAMYWSATDSKWYFGIIGTTASSAATTLPAAGASVVLHGVYTAAGLALYVNGVLAGSATAAISITIDEIYIGSEIGLEAVNKIGGVFRMVSTYASTMTAAEVAADYADIIKALAAGGSPSPIPYLWTPKGTGVFDNCRDAATSTGAPHYNYGWLTGIPGTMPAAMEMRLEPSVFGSACKRLAVSMLDYDTQFDPLTDGVLYNDRDGTGNAASSNGSYLSTTIDTTFTLQIDTDQTDAYYRRLQGREVAIYSRIQSGSTGAFQIKLVLIVGGTIISEAKNVANATGFRLLRTPFLVMPPQSAPEIADTAISSIQLHAGRSTGSGTSLIDWGMVMARPLVEVDVSAVGALTAVIYENTVNRTAETGGSAVWAALPRRGDVLRPLPNRNNLIQVAMGDETVDPLIAWNVTATINVTPRWSIL